MGKWLSSCLVTFVFCAGVFDAAAESFDLVLRGGRVIDPETHFDAVANVAIADSKIVAISSEALEGVETIDVGGLVVAPGFIDLHTHTPTPLGQRLQVRDGVTTALELEAGAYPVADYGEEIRTIALANYGASVGYGSLRFEVLHGIRQAHLVTGEMELVGWRGSWTAVRSVFGFPPDPFTRKASPADRERLRAAIEQGLSSGGLGIGVPLDYFSEGIDGDELRMVFEVAGAHQVPLFIHLRRGVNGDPAGLEEALALAEESGAPLHICHIQHNAMGNVDHFLAEIRAARARGVDVTTETLPYNAGSAFLSSAVFSRDWQTIFDIDYGDVEWAATGERFDQAMWEEYRQKYPNGQVIHHYVKEDWTRRALAEPGVIVVSDALPIVDLEIKTAPHTGSFAKILGRYVRETPLLPLREALAKMTLYPAQRLEKVAPQFERKGRVQVGADADLTVFDASRVVDRGTYQDPFQPSAGIVHVIVGGVPVVRDEDWVDDVAPGQQLFAPTN